MTTDDRDEIIAQNQALNDTIDKILLNVPEDWDNEAAATSIVLDYVRELEARLDAMRVPRCKYPEDADGAPWPNPSQDPNAFADAAEEYRKAMSGCRCPVFGKGTPEHPKGFLCEDYASAARSFNDDHPATDELPA